MLTTGLTHPDLLRALAAAGHGSAILVADGNYPVATATNPAAETIFLNITRGVIDAATMLRIIAQILPVESATVMAADLLTPQVPPIWSVFSQILADAGHNIDEFKQIPRHDFYAQAQNSDTAAVIATGESAMYGNLLLTVGVRT